MPRTLETTVYQYDELSEKAQEKARQWFRDGDGFSYHAESVIEDAKSIAAFMGICINDVSYSVSYSQGDGASFTGSYSYAKGSVRAVKEYAPQDTELHRIVTELYQAQRREFYGISATISQGGHLSHSGTMSFMAETANNTFNMETCRYRFDESANRYAVIDALKDFADWIYRTLEKEYEYQNSDESVSDNIRINEYEFTEDGHIA